MAKNLKELEFVTRVLREDNPQLLQNKINQMARDGYCLVSNNVAYDKDGFVSVIMQKLKNP